MSGNSAPLPEIGRTQTTPSLWHNNKKVVVRANVLSIFICAPVVFFFFDIAFDHHILGVTE